MAEQFVPSDVVILSTEACYGESGAYYTTGTILAVGSFLERDKIHYSIQLTDPNRSTNRFGRNNVILTDCKNIHKILSKNPSIPRIGINDRLSVNDSNAIVKYIGRALSRDITLTDDLEPDSYKTKSLVRQSSLEPHKNAETLYNHSDNTIYIGFEVLNSNNCGNNNRNKGIINGIRYFYTDSNNECILVKASTLTTYCTPNKYELLVSGYLSNKKYKKKKKSKHKTKSKKKRKHKKDDECDDDHLKMGLDVLIPIIGQYILDKSIGFTIEKLWSSTYSYGTCSVSTYKAKYGVFDINHNIYGPQIDVEFTSSYKSAGKTHKTRFKGLYGFECNGEGIVNYSDKHGIKDVKSITIHKRLRDHKPLDINRVLRNIGRMYHVKKKKVLVREFKKHNIKLHGININRIEELGKEFTCKESHNCVIFSNDALIEQIRERDKDKVICFDGNGMVLMANGLRKRIYELNIGDYVMSLGNKISRIECRVVNIINKEIEMVELLNDNDGSSCWITHEHPILIEKDCRIGYNIESDTLCGLQSLNADEIDKFGLEWILPKHLYNGYKLRFQERIYNFILDKNHSINVNGFWCCTLGHDYKGKVIEHQLWGNSSNIRQYLQQQSQTYPEVVVKVKLS